MGNKWTPEELQKLAQVLRIKLGPGELAHFRKVVEVMTEHFYPRWEAAKVLRAQRRHRRLESRLESDAEESPQWP